MKDLLLNIIDEQTKGYKEVAVLLSGGVDSTACLLALLELGKKPVAYTFTFENYESQDFKDARETCKKFNVPFTPVYLPNQLEQLQKDVYHLVTELKLKNKAEIECTWPVKYAIEQIKEKVIVTGHAADGHFGLSKKAMINYRHTLDLFDQFRRDYFSKENVAQNRVLREIAESNGKQIIFPYLDSIMFDYFIGQTWESLNKPKEKMAIRNCFIEEFTHLKLKNHTNLQLGDSKIADHFTKLLHTEWNTRNLKSVVGIYNDLSKGVVVWSS